MRRFPILILMAAVLLPWLAVAADSEHAAMESVLFRYREILLREPDAETGLVEGWVRSIDAGDGSWADINYLDTSAAEWEPASHLSRIRSMALALARDADAVDAGAVDADAVRATCVSALDHWVGHRYQCRNWWFNEIGVPRLMRDILVLLKDPLPTSIQSGAIEVLAQLKVRGTGANLTWSAELSLHHACLTGQADQLLGAAQRIWDEISVGQREGIQADWSYFQHGARLQAHHYGAAFVSQVCLTAWQLQHTPWAIPPDKRAIMDEYLTEGLPWMSRGAFNSPGTVDRKVSRLAGLEAVEEVRLALTRWCEVSPLIQPRLVDLVRTMGEAALNGVAGFKHFPVADFTVFHRPAGSFFLKTISDRTHLTESINRENSKGVPFLNCGDHYLICNGREYVGLPPVWDWSRLPGLTTTAENTGQERTSFVGGLGNGASGLTAMDYCRRGAAGTWHLRKLWVFHGDTMLCLLGPVEGSTGSGSLVTSVEQCRQRGAVDYIDVETGARGTTETAEDVSVLAVDHHGVRYSSLDGHPLRLNVGPAYGNWAAINGALSARPVSVPVLHLDLLHDADFPVAGYVVHLDPGNAPEKEILRNDDRAQAVRFGDGTVFAAFYESSDDPSLPVQVSQPCLVLLDGQGLWLCDPTQEGTTVEVTVEGRRQTVALPENGFGWRAR